ncbi:FHA domain-containing protein [Streptomyces sp. NBC_00829]|uniref:FHA domain-containing protein n=1 Tax=Streptomyces sp. NBC_00829 TaxID=2903679 RepID=UPI003862D566|nr:FHA domain-containing protein [Streptomyces sp. NBC_00829]
MYSIIVVPAHTADPTDQIRLAPGEKLSFGRTAPPNAERHLTLRHQGVSRRAGELAATGTYWSLSNSSADQTYVVENPEGAGEHIKIAPGRIDAPVPFEFSRVVLPAGGELLHFDVWAPRHEYAEAAQPSPGGEPTATAFPLDRSKRYFLVLAALCEPRLRGEPHAPLPTAEQTVERLRPIWPAANRAAVQWNIDYLAVKLRLKPGPDTADPGPRLNGKKESLVSLALRFDLVRETDLLALTAENGGLG